MEAMARAGAAEAVVIPISPLARRLLTEAAGVVTTLPLDQEQPVPASTLEAAVTPASTRHRPGSWRVVAMLRARSMAPQCMLRRKGMPAKLPRCTNASKCPPSEWSKRALGVK